MAKEKQISLKVYGHDFSIRVEPKKEKLLESAAHLVDERMHEIASSGIVSLHRVAMLAAIDIAFQALDNLPAMSPGKGGKKKDAFKEIEARVDKILDNIDASLSKD
jgi:hypothetical protein